MATTPADHISQTNLLRAHFTTRGWSQALAALDYAQRLHCHTRKDGITPEFNHQVQIGLMLIDVAHHLHDPQTVLVVAMLHDVCEDYPVPFTTIETLFGPEARDGVDALTKTHLGHNRSARHVTAAQIASPVASVVKGADRIHNLSTMKGVFTPAKVREYVEETRHHILPMITAAATRYPRQRGAYNVFTATMERLTGQAALIAA